MRLPLVSLALALATGLASSAALAQNDPRYFPQIRAELQAMGLPAQCAAANAHVGSCRVRASAPVAAGTPSGSRRYLLTVEYSDETDTIYVYLDHYAALRADAPNAATASRRMLEMNWEMLVGKFEWSPGSGEVRLSAVINTDSNFDRRAFRGVLRALLRLGDRYADEAARLTGSAVGENALAPTPSPTPNPTANPAAAPVAPAGATLTPMPAPPAHP